MAAGNWYTTAGIGDANVAVAARTIRVALDESVKNNSVIGHPVIREHLSRDVGLGQLMGELGVSVGLAAVGQGSLLATVEGTEATPTNWSVTNSATATPARRAFARDVSDFARSVQDSMLSGDMAPSAYATLVYEGFRLWSNSIVENLMSYASAATYEVGTTATALTWAALQNGVLDFKNRGVADGALGLISVKGAKDLASDSLSLGGAIANRMNTQAMVADVRGGAYLFSEWGVDFYLTSEEVADGGDELGMIIGPGAFNLKHQRVPLPAEADLLADAGWYTMEMRRPGGGRTRTETVSHFGSAILEAQRFAAVRYVA